jgi:regulator of chromosome condensation
MLQDANGPIGILPDHGKIETPLRIMKDHHTVKIASGCDHLVCLTREGEIYTLGAIFFILSYH